MKARLQTLRATIREIADRWHEQYSRGTNYAPDKKAIHERLQLLDVETATADDVVAIIGNRSWTETRCDGCNQYVTTYVTVGDEPDYESATASLCYACAKEAFAVFDCIAHEDCAANKETLGRACTAASLTTSTSPGDET